MFFFLDYTVIFGLLFKQKSKKKRVNIRGLTMELGWMTASFENDVTETENWIMIVNVHTQGHMGSMRCSLM